MSEETQAAPQPDGGLMGPLSEGDLKKESPEQEQYFDVREPEENSHEQAPKFERPEDLPSELWDEENGQFKGNELYEEYKKERDKALGLRQKLAKGAPKPPESAQDYKINAEKVAERLNIEVPEDDPGFEMFKEVAHKNGLDQETFENVYMDYMEKAMEHNKNLEQQPVSKEDQEKYIADEMKKLGESAPQIVNSIKAWNKKLFQEGVLSESDLKAAHNMGRTAEEIRVINAYRQAAGNISIPENVGVIEGQESEQEIQSIMMKPEYKTDPALQKKVEDFYKRKYS